MLKPVIEVEEREINEIIRKEGVTEISTCTLEFYWNELSKFILGKVLESISKKAFRIFLNHFKRKGLLRKQDDLELIIKTGMPGDEMKELALPVPQQPFSIDNISCKVLKLPRYWVTEKIKEGVLFTVFVWVSYPFCSQCGGTEFEEKGRLRKRIICEKGHKSSSRKKLARKGHQKLRRIISQSIGR